MEAGEVLEKLADYDIEVSFIVPTPTGYKKGIMDAIRPLREYLEKKGIHDYAIQKKSEKKIVPAYFVKSDSLIPTKISLYRPQTKNGDPRIWVYSLQKHCKPNYLICLIAFEEKLYVINANDNSLFETIDTPGSPFYELLSNFRPHLSDPAFELLEMMKRLSSKGFVITRHTGDTAIGITLAEELGLSAYDISKGPDYKGIEIKAFRDYNNRSNLFSQIPCWYRSPCKNGKDLLENYGYIDPTTGRRRLACTVRSKIPNPQGLFFKVNYSNDSLDNFHASFIPNLVTLWELDTLRKRLAEKHHETFWVETEVDNSLGMQAFYYRKVIHTKNPRTSALEVLLDDGTITMDYTLKEKPDGSPRDHGYLFKIHKQDIKLLIPEVGTYFL